jgi:DNA-binding response OmpR family regulator
MKHIVIVDDDPGIQDAFPLIFTPDQYKVTKYANGNALLNKELIVPDIYILDKQLSGMDGLDICKFLKSNEKTKHIPVIMLSANPNIKKQAALAGADAALEKPFKIKMLRILVDKYLDT